MKKLISFLWLSFLPVSSFALDFGDDGGGNPITGAVIGGADDGGVLFANESGALATDTNLSYSTSTQGLNVSNVHVSSGITTDGVLKAKYFVHPAVNSPKSGSGFVDPTAAITVAAGGSNVHKSFPGVAMMNDGRLIAVYRSGTSHTSTDSNIAAKYSSDLGVNWAGEATIASSATFGNYLQGALVSVVSNGDIFVTYNTANDPATADQQAYVQCSHDNGATWETAVGVNSGYLTDWDAGNIVETDAGSYILPVSVWDGETPGSGNNSAGVVFSTDNGVTWGGYVKVFTGGAVYTQAESTIIKLVNGDLFIATRDLTTGHIYTSKSTDDGATWSEAADAFAGISRPTLHLLPSGGILCVFRDASSNSSYRISWDSGVTWNAETDLKSDSTFNYAGIASVGGGVVVVVYSDEATTSNASVKAAFFMDGYGTFPTGYGNLNQRIEISSTPITSGGSGQILVENSSNKVGSSSSLTWSATSGLYSSGSNVTQFQIGNTLPVYGIANNPLIGLNLYYASGWKYGAGSSSKYGAFFGHAADTGEFQIANTAAAGNAAGAATTQYVMKISKTGAVAFPLYTTAGYLVNDTSGNLTSTKAMIMNYSAKTATYTATASDYFITMDATDGIRTVNLPTAVGISGQMYSIQKIDSGVNAVTVDAFSTQTIGGVGETYILDDQWDTVTIISNNANWLIQSFIAAD